MHKYDVWFYVVVFVFMALLSLSIIGEEKNSNDMNMSNLTKKVEIKR